MADRKTHGFTLIELLVVIAIIAILAAILFPVFTAAKKSGQKAACLNNLKQLGAAITLYSADYGDRLPYATAFSKGWIDVGWNSDGPCLRRVNALGKEIGILARYVKNSGVWFCPAYTGAAVICEYDNKRITAAQNQTSYEWVAWTYILSQRQAGHWLCGIRVSDIPRPSRQMVIHEAPYADPGAHDHLTNVLFADTHAGSFNTGTCKYFGGDVWTVHSNDGWNER